LGATAWIEANELPSFTSMKEMPALESRLLRTQPLIVTRLPVETSPPSSRSMEVALMIPAVSLSGGE